MQNQFAQHKLQAQRPESELPNLGLGTRGSLDLGDDEPFKAVLCPWRAEDEESHRSERRQAAENIERVAKAS
jgi:hypothetical protein